MWSTPPFGKPCVEMEKLFRKKRLLLLYFLLYYGFYIDRSQRLILKYLQRHENLNLSMIHSSCMDCRKNHVVSFM